MRDPRQETLTEMAIALKRFNKKGATLPGAFRIYREFSVSVSDYEWFVATKFLNISMRSVNAPPETGIRCRCFLRNSAKLFRRSSKPSYPLV